MKQSSFIKVLLICAPVASILGFSPSLKRPWRFSEVLAVDGSREQVIHDVAVVDDGDTRILSDPPLSSIISTDEKDNRPHEQRVDAPRTARRLNHVFKYLYRHDIPDKIKRMDSFTYLKEHAGYNEQQILAMNQTFPPLLTLSPVSQLHPKLRFLQETLEEGGDSESHPSQRDQVVSQNTTSLSILPPQYFGARLERILAPRHAFLVYANLTHGPDLVHNPKKWEAFLLAARRPKRFAALCQAWQQQKQQQQPSASHQAPVIPTITAKQIEAFDVLFGRGLMAATRNYLVQENNTWPLQYINISASEMIDLLVQHGANPNQLDHRGVSLLHWAAGTGHLEAISVLLRQSHRQQQKTQMTNSSSTATLDIWSTRTTRDAATALHWAAAGAKAREFGCGGHVDVCHYLLQQLEPNRRKPFVNVLTKDGNSALMWAAWSGSLDTVKLLVRHRAETRHSNRNGCTVAHWAASGGNVEVCRYLHETVGVDFSAPNHGGNTPLTHAVAFGRSGVVEWLREEVLVDESDDVAFNLAKDFVHWTDGDARRQQVLALFEEWYSGAEQENDDEEGDDDEEDFFL